MNLEQWIIEHAEWLVWGGGISIIAIAILMIGRKPPRHRGE